MGLNFFDLKGRNDEGSNKDKFKDVLYSNLYCIHGINIGWSSLMCLGCLLSKYSKPKMVKNKPHVANL
jgi:hypothetical protein